MKTYFLIIVLIFICLFGLRAQVPQNVSDSLQNVLNIYQGSSQVPGISAAVNIHNVGVWTGISGVSHANISLSPARAITAV